MDNVTGLIVPIASWLLAIYALERYAQISFGLWREAIRSETRLACKKYLAVDAGISTAASVLFGMVGFVALAPQFASMLVCAGALAVGIGILSAVNIAIRQKAGRQLASRQADNTAT